VDEQREFVFPQARKFIFWPGLVVGQTTVEVDAYLDRGDNIV
jgi:hypothetical protein